jgi:pimeloyl-ACP methyl ester carboxylesterase
VGFDNFQQLSFYNLGCEIYYWYKRGESNKYVILLHGAGCDHVMFEKQAGIFDNYHVIAWDARGHGLSKLDRAKKFGFKDMYDDCLKLLEIHKIERAIFIGQSMGGNLAQEIARRNHKLAEKLVLIDSTRNTQKLNFLEKLSIKISRFVFNWYPWKVLIRQSANACGNTESTKKYVRQCFEKMEKENFIEIMMSLFSCLREDREYKFEQPVLLICGKNDTTGNIRKAMESWPKNDDSCKLCMIENAGHNSNQDNPDKVNKSILAFIN